MKTIEYVGGLLALMTTTAASATETITYSYDAKGRLAQVTLSGSVNNNVQTSYSHDAAENRTRVTTTGSSH